MAGHVLDHTLFAASRSSSRTKLIWFVLWTSAVVGNFWWFRQLAMGIYGPVNEHKGWQWRSSWNVSSTHTSVCAQLTTDQIYN